MRVDIVIMTALSDEFDACLHERDNWFSQTGESGSHRHYKLSKSRNGLVIALVPIGGMGQLEAAIATYDVILDCSPKLIILAGIAAGLDGVDKGDIIVPLQLVDYELEKISNTGDQARPQYYRTSSEFLSLVENFKRNNFWSSKIKTRRPDKRKRSPSIHVFGTIFSGNKIVAKQEKIEGLRKIYPKGHGIEMESVGVATVLHKIGSNINFLMIKGIQDKADETKDDTWRDYSLEISAKFTFSFIDSLDPKDHFYDHRYEINQNNIEMIANFVTPNPLSISEFENKIVKSVIESSLDEINKVIKHEYSKNLSQGSNFLIRANALFGSASRVCATSLDYISTFWTDKSSRFDTRNYLENQAPNGKTARLFVFSDADNTHYHAKILDDHAHQYENVFVCSLEDYKNLLKSVKSDLTISELLQKDFAVISYMEGNNTSDIFAQLDKNNLSYTSIQIDKPGLIKHKEFVEIFETLEKMKPGEFNAEKKIFKWRPGMWKEIDWAPNLQIMFNERTSDYYHIVYFDFESKKESEIRELFSYIKKSVLNSSDQSSLAIKYGIKNIWFGKNHPFKVEDGTYSGQLYMSKNRSGSYILIMQFDNQSGLKRFYEDQEHSTLRRYVYELIEPKISYLYQISEKGELPGSLSVAENRKIVYEFIEKILSNHIQRCDYQSEEMIREMVAARTPYGVDED
jgi:nucleoside phosphorylase